MKRKNKNTHTPRTVTTWLMKNGKRGEIFYSNKPDRHLTAISTHYKRKIKTERLVAITTAKSKIKTFHIVKVILC